jgi:hypothetical protein
MADRPDLPQLRAAQIHSPDLVAAMLKLHRAYLAATDQLMTMAAGGDEGGPVVMTSPEAAVHNFFRRNTTISRRWKRRPRRSGAVATWRRTMSMPR